MKMSSTKGGPYLALVGGLGVSTGPQAAGTIRGTSSGDHSNPFSLHGARLQVQI